MRMNREENFLARNRIMAGHSNAVIMAESKV